MTWIASAYDFVKTWWWVVTLVGTLLTTSHASSAQSTPLPEGASVSDNANKTSHVTGSWAAAGLLGVASAGGAIATVHSAKKAPSAAPKGVDGVLHQLNVAYAAMSEADDEGTDMNDLNKIIVARKGRKSPAQGKPS